MGLIGPTFFQDNPKEIRLLEHPYQCKFFLLFCTKKKKKHTFSILHIYFYKTSTSVYLFYTFIQQNINSFNIFCCFLRLFSSPPLSPSQTQLPSTSLLDRWTIQDQTNPRSKTHSSRNPLNLKPKSSPTHPLDFSTHHRSRMWRHYGKVFEGLRFENQNRI